MLSTLISKFIGRIEFARGSFFAHDIFVDNAAICVYNGVIPIPIRNMDKDILKSAGFNAFSKCSYP